MLKKYKVVSIFIIVCFLSAFIALYNGVTASRRIADEIASKKEYAYTYSESMMVMFGDYQITYEDLSKLVQNISDSNITLSNLSLYLNQTQFTHYPEILLKQNEELSIPNFKSIDRLPEKNIIISDSITKEKIVSSGKIDFNVYSHIDSLKYAFTKGTIIIGAKDYFSLYNNELKEKDIILTIASNKKDIYEVSSQIKNRIKEKYPNATISILESNSNENIFQSAITGQSIIFIGLFIFALLNTMIISYYLVFVRKREIAIRKAFGFTNKMVIKMLMKDIGSLVVLSAVLGIVIQLVIDFLSSSLNFNNYITLLLPMLMCIIISTFVAVIIPIRFVLKIDPSEGVKR